MKVSFTLNSKSFFKIQYRQLKKLKHFSIRKKIKSFFSQFIYLFVEMSISMNERTEIEWNS